MKECKINRHITLTIEEGEDDMVRKFILYRTNKDKTGFYPSYAVYHLDYSENWKDPLSRRVIVTDNEQQAWEFFDDLVKTEMIGKGGFLKRGWDEFLDVDSRVA